MDKTTGSRATISGHHKGISRVWIIPLIAFAIGVWMLFQYISSRGPEITLILPDATGIEAGKTEIKSRNVKVGTITEVELSENYDYIIATAQMEKQATRMLVKDSLLWIVEPRIGAEGITGLDTLLSGSYLELKPGISEEKMRQFKVLDLPPVAGPDTKGLRVVLTHNQANKLKVGEPVLHHGFSVGRVEKVKFDVESGNAEYQLFIFAPYDSLVFEHTQFWLDSGIEFKLDTSGIDFKVGSLQTILSGGVTFDVPENTEAGHRMQESLTKFELFNDYSAVLENRYSEYVHFALLFDESVRGLEPGAPVEYRGVRIGTVEKVPLAIPVEDDGKLSNRIPVLIRAEIERISEALRETSVEGFKERIRYQVSQGLRGTLKTGNLITAALYVDVDFYAEPGEVKPTTFAGYETLPVIAGGFAQIQKQITEFLYKVNSLPLEEMVNTFDSTLKSTQNTMRSANKVANDLDLLLSDSQTQNMPTELNNSLRQLQKTLQGFDPDSPMYQELQETLIELEEVMQQLQPVLKKVNEKPNALVFGEDARPDPVPTGGEK